MQGILIRAQSAYNRGFKMLVLMLQVMLSYNIGSFWQSSFREDFLEIDQSKTRIYCGGHVW
jgi:hypothetical protein